MWSSKHTVVCHFEPEQLLATYIVLSTCDAHVEVRVRILNIELIL